MAGLKKHALEEWKVAMENARHFNDLLIRFRMLGLPMVITLAIAGIAANTIIDKIMLYQWSVPIISTASSLIILTAVIWHTRKKWPIWGKKNERHRIEKEQEPPLTISGFELSIWIVFLAIIVWFAVDSMVSLIASKEIFHWSNVREYSLTPVAIYASVILLFSLYLMDRFYYYKLLVLKYEE